MPHRRGSFHEDWNDLLVRFENRRACNNPRLNLLEQATQEALHADLCEPFDPHKALFERSNAL